MSSTFDLKSEWDAIVQQRLAPLDKKANKIQSLKYDDFQSTLQTASHEFHQSRVTSTIHKLKPVFDQLDVFVTAITSLVQASPELAGFIWGTTQAVIIVCTFLPPCLATSSYLSCEQPLTTTL